MENSTEEARIEKFTPVVTLDLMSASEAAFRAAIKQFHEKTKDLPLSPFALTTGIHYLDQHDCEQLLRRNPAWR
jgi:hypothetical protein